MLFLIAELLFEFLKLRLNELGVIYEHYDLLDYDNFHLKVSYDCF